MPSLSTFLTYTCLHITFFELQKALFTLFKILHIVCSPLSDHPSFRSFKALLGEDAADDYQTEVPRGQQILRTLAASGLLWPWNNQDQIEELERRVKRRDEEVRVLQDLLRENEGLELPEIEEGNGEGDRRESR